MPISDNNHWTNIIIIIDMQQHKQNMLYMEKIYYIFSFFLSLSCMCLFVVSQLFRVAYNYCWRFVKKRSWHFVENLVSLCTEYMFLYTLCYDIKSDSNQFIYYFCEQRDKIRIKVHNKSKFIANKMVHLAPNATKKKHRIARIILSWVSMSFRFNNL